MVQLPFMLWYRCSLISHLQRNTHPPMGWKTFPEKQMRLCDEYKPLKEMDHAWDFGDETLNTFQ